MQALLLVAMMLNTVDGGSADAARLLTFDFPQTVQVMKTDSEVVSLGVPVAIRAVKTKLTPPEVAAFFKAQVERHGLYVPPAKHLSRIVANETLTAFDPRAEVAYTFVLQPNPDKTTTVIVTTSDLKRREPADGRPLPVAIYPGGDGLVRSRHEGGESFTYTIAGVAAADVQAFYGKTLAASGWRKVSKNLYARGDRELRLSLGEAEGHVSVSGSEGPRSLTLEQ